MIRIGRATLWAGALTVFVAASCSSPETAQEGETESAQVPEPMPAPAAPSLNDAEIAAIVVAANGIDVRHGELAVERASDARVREFAETMIRDHNAVNRSAGELVARLGVTPQANEVSRSLETSAAGTMESLSGQSGAAFDRAYIEHEVGYHQAVLDALDDLLIPNATNAELKATLEGVRPAFEAHMRHAQTLLDELGS